MRCSVTARTRATVVTLVLLAAGMCAPAAGAHTPDLRAPLPAGLEATPAAESTPVVNEVTPPSAPALSAVVVKGEHLVESGAECPPCTNTTVTFEGVAAPAIILRGNETELEVIAPPHAQGQVSVLVSVGGVAAASGAQFTYLPPPPPPPPVTVTSPTNGAVTSGTSELVAGTAGTEGADSKRITVTLFAGSTLGTRMEEHNVEQSGGRWSTVFAPLGPGTYTVDAKQSGEAGSLGISAPVTFTINPSQGTPPTAAFTWLPTTPKTGESVSLVSSSSDPHSPIIGYAWLLTGNAFQSSGPLITTSFSTSGPHVVKLRVTSADGLSSVASETIPVASRPASLMQPFPVVRIVGTDGQYGVKLSLLSVEAPGGAQITVKCKGRGCPLGHVRRVARASASGSTTLKFRRFERRRLAPGVTLVVRVYAEGEIGKYTRFVVRRGKLPKRVDTCLEPSGAQPIACPAS